MEREGEAWHYSSMRWKMFRVKLYLVFEKKLSEQIVLSFHVALGYYIDFGKFNFPPIILGPWWVHMSVVWNVLCRAFIDTQQAQYARHWSIFC